MLAVSEGSSMIAIVGVSGGMRAGSSREIARSANRKQRETERQRGAGNTEAIVSFWNLKAHP